MKEFLMLFWNESGDGQYQVNPMQETMASWQSWIGQIALNGKLISTKPIQWEGSTVVGPQILRASWNKKWSLVT
ncbi:MAG: hypothetical protein IPO07_07885 [Haliscomenobacter sp.]|nr:hypothetical protein [Haliscomenobacter sp.]MBK9488714.1 hypothetical protein [Haliscomenobacter sp.]